MTPYETLGVDPKASAEELKEAYRRACSAAHPDREGGSTERQQAVNTAWEIVGDPERRAAYDRGDGPGRDIESEARSLVNQAMLSVLERWEQTMTQAVQQRHQGPATPAHGIFVLNSTREPIAPPLAYQCTEDVLRERRRMVQHERPVLVARGKQLARILRTLPRRDGEPSPWEQMVQSAIKQNERVLRELDEDLKVWDRAIAIFRAEFKGGVAEPDPEFVPSPARSPAPTNTIRVLDWRAPA